MNKGASFFRVALPARGCDVAPLARLRGVALALRPHASLLPTACVLAFLAAACGDSSENDKPRACAASRTRLPIFGGAPAQSGDVLSTVGLVNSNGSLYCTGTLIAPRVVVSAGHCIEDGGIPGPGFLRILAGVLDGAELSFEDGIEVERIAMHPDYASLFSLPSEDPNRLAPYNDLAIIVTAEPVSAVPVAPVLPAAELDAVLTAGRPFIISGYGLTETDGEDRLMTATAPFVRRAGTEMIIGEAGTPGACSGDSGGPGYVQVGETVYVAGATSRTATSGSCSEGAIYTLVSAYEDFLIEASEGLYPPLPQPPQVPSDPEDC